MLAYDQLFIDGVFKASTGSDVIEVENPATQQIIGRVPHATEADVDGAVEVARRAFDEGPWPQMTPAERVEVLRRAADLLRERSDEFAQTITLENGCPITYSGLVQVFPSQLTLDYYVGLGDQFPFEEERDGVLGKIVVRGAPVGVVAAIVPWNVPLFVGINKLAPALLAGCTVVLKPSPETPLDAYLLAQLFAEAGLPPGVLNVIPADREVSEYLVRHPGVDKISFTGSVAAGRQIGAICGEQLKRVTLELGGKSASIVLPDADKEAALNNLLFSGLMNTGQACVAQTRILVQQDDYDDFAERLGAAVGAMTLGDTLDEGTQVGPLISERQRERVENYIRIGQDEGAKVAVGGGRPAGMDTGYWLEPTVFVNVDNSMRIAQEEIFGPVLAVIPYRDEAEAIRIANDSDYGLSGSVWTADPEHGLDVGRKIRTGTFSVNGFSLDMAGPFGGFKQSGIGRELGPEGLKAFLEYQSLYKPMG